MVGNLQSGGRFVAACAFRGLMVAKQADRSERTRGAILKAGRDLFGGQGFHATSMDQIARAIGMAKGAVYHHFKTKEAVFEAVFEEASEELVR